MDSLQKKIDQVKDDHAAETLERLKSAHEETAVNDAMFLLGRIKQNDHLAQAIATNLSAQTVRALERFQQEKRHEVLGFSTFDEFLNESEYSPMSKRQYYDRLNLIRGHGDEIYDLLTSIGISVRSQKLLGDGDLAIKGDMLVVGDREIDVTDKGIIKDVLNDLFEEKRNLRTENEKLTKKVEKQKDQIDRGQDEYDELRRAYDNLESTPRLQRCVMTLTNAFFNLTEAVGELDDDEKAARAKDDLKLVAGLYFSLSDAYGVSVPLSDDRELELRLGKMKPVEEMTDDEKRETFLDRASAEVNTEDLD